MIDSIRELSKEIISKAQQVPMENSLLVGISGIDASGKGSIARQLLADLEGKGNRVALINVDGWLNLPHVRFGTDDPGRHFYRNALRLDEMFGRLVLPLKNDRTVDVTADFAEETAVEYRSNRYEFRDVDIVIVEGVFLFKRKYVRHFDLKIWIECSFETALQRAVLRSQEGLGREETIRTYKTIYFPAQRYHSWMDGPLGEVDVIFAND